MRSQRLGVLGLAVMLALHVFMLAGIGQHAAHGEWACAPAPSVPHPGSAMAHGGLALSTDGGGDVAAPAPCGPASTGHDMGRACLAVLGALVLALAAVATRRRLAGLVPLAPSDRGHVAPRSLAPPLAVLGLLRI